MSKKHLLTAVVALFLVILIFTIVKYTVNNQSLLVSPILEKLAIQLTIPSPSPTLAPPKAPKTFQFDSSTDLKSELEKVNPQVLEDDFAGF